MEYFFYLFFSAIILLLCSIFIFNTFYIVEQYEKAVLMRLGKFVHMAEPGFHSKLPIIHSIYQRIDMRTRTEVLTAEKSLTKDTVAVSVETVMFWHVIDAERAAFSVENYKDAVKQTALICLREMIGATELSTLLSNRETVDKMLKEAIEKRISLWGLEVISVDIKDVTIPTELYDVMSRQAQAERERDARVTLASAEVLIAEKTKEAADIYDTSPTALELRKMGLTYEMAKNGTTILVPSSMANSLAGGLVGGMIK